MNIEFTKSFDKGFANLSDLLQKKSHKTIDTFLRAYESRQFPKGLRIHKCGPFFSVTIAMNYRIFVYPITDGIRFVFIGNHEDADRYLKK